MLLIKIVLIMSLLYIFYQDLKERMVYGPLFFIVGLDCGILHYNNTLPELFYISVGINLLFVSALLLIIFLYSTFKLRVPFNQSFGFGDVLLFIALTFSFSSISFLVIFISSLIFSLVFHLILKKKSTFKTVSLAGNMSLFFALAYLGFWSGFINSVYSI